MTVSVIIPNRNNAPFIVESLRSVADDPAVREILVYDDGSTDNSVDAIKDFGGPKVRVTAGGNSVGATRARHMLIAKTDQPFLSFVDGDDFLAPETISACLDEAMASELDMCIPQQVKVAPDGSRPQLFVPALDRILAGEDAFWLTFGEWRLGAPRGVVRRDTYLQAAQGFQFYGYSDDELLTRRMVLACSRVGGAPGTYFYRYTEREPQLDQSIGRLRTMIKTIELAHGRGRSDWTPTLRLHRNHAVMEIVRLMRRVGPGRVPAGELLVELEGIGVPRRGADWLYSLVAFLARAIGG